EETVPPETVPEETLPPEPERPPRQPEGPGEREKEPEPPEPVIVPPIPEESVSRIGWIRAEYASPAGAARAEKGTRGSSRFFRQDGTIPKTGDRSFGAASLLLVLGLSGAGLAALIWKRKKTFCFLILLGIPFFYTPEACAEEAGPEACAEEIRPEACAEEIRMVEKIEADSDGAGFCPEERYTAEDGREYQLDFYHQIETVVPEREEERTETLFFRGLESEEQLPASVPVQEREEETGRTGTGELYPAQIVSTESYWTGDFSFPVTFYDYGAGRYEFQGVSIPEETALEYLLEHSGLLLEEAGCSPERYQIETIFWSGDSYMEQGLLCRKAEAAGRKLVSDYRAEYRGRIRYPETTEKQWEMVYRPVPQPVPEETASLSDARRETETEPETAPAVEVREPEPRPERDGRRYTRIVAAFTISIIALLPALIYLIVLLKKKKRGMR
ncbi:MAG: hypothetical protein Q4F29_08070, partial [Lachnospiraceae bacterium]|nr:hypothetical protein [Lachnospiraceae bacterium]